MGNKKDLVKRIAGYFFYTIAITLVLLWALLPVEQFRQWLQTYVHAGLPQVVMEIEEAKRLFPLGVSFETAKISETEGGEVTGVIDVFALRPDFPGLLGLQPALRHHAEMYQGKASGTWRYDRKSATVGLTGELAEIRLELTRLEYWLQRLVEGSLSAQYTGRFDLGTHQLTELQTVISIRDGLMGLRQPFFSYSSLPFKSAVCTLTGNAAAVRIRQGEVESPLFSAAFQGEVEMKQPVAASVLSLNGTISPRPEFFAGIKDAGELERVRSAMKNEAGIPFSITGELGAPGVTLGELSRLNDPAEKRGGE